MKKRILLSAFAFAPNTGSEAGSGWHWACELAKQHEVVVLTDISRRPLVEPVVSDVSNLRVIYYRPSLLRNVPLNSTTAQVLYSLWQYSLLPFARRLHYEYQFNLAIHLTYGVYRHPSFLGFLGVPFVFGPVGGGEDAPWCLKQSLPIQDKLRELARSLLNYAAKFNPFLWLALSRANLIMVRTAETAHALPSPYGRSAVVHQEIGTPLLHRRLPLQPRRSGEVMQVMFAGRLLGWKGIHFALRAVAQAQFSGANLKFTIIGSGPNDVWLKNLAVQLGLDDSVLQWVDRIPQDQLFALYEHAHCLLFPSLHDSGGNVVLEALCLGVPVICLDLGGPQTLVDAQCATIISTKGRNEEEVINALTRALMDLVNNEPKRFGMANSALLRSKDLAWDKRISTAMRLIEQHCFPESN